MSCIVVEKELDTGRSTPAMLTVGRSQSFAHRFKR
jgi:hypothetical protein